jgi:heat shock protein HslJ
MKHLLYFLSVILFTTCSTQKELADKPQVMWVKGIQANCTGVGPMKCLLIQKGEEIKPGEWQYLYTGIEGFQFQNGTRYKLLVSEEKLKASDVPADGSSIKYSLIEVLEKKPEPVYALHDIWALESIDGNPVENPGNNSGLTIPSIEININEMKIMGTDGCNQFFGPLVSVEDETIEFGDMGSTMKMCFNMELSDKFNNNLRRVSKYKRKGMMLIFMDNSELELLQFRKVD